jgi:hypothetical protein
MLWGGVETVRADVVYSFTMFDAADTTANCNATFTICDIPENILLDLPFLAIAGDVVLEEPNSTVVSDVFRIFNDAIDTGAGTGLGDKAFLYSSDDTTLPDPSTYSANVVFIHEDPSGVTSYFGNGTNYLLATPEPRTFGLLSLVLAAMAILARRRSGRFQGDR